MAKSRKTTKPLPPAFAQIEGAMKRLLSVPKSELGAKLQERKRNKRRQKLTASLAGPSK